MLVAASCQSIPGQGMEEEGRPGQQQPDRARTSGQGCEASLGLAWSGPQTTGKVLRRRAPQGMSPPAGPRAQAGIEDPPQSGSPSWSPLLGALAPGFIWGWWWP